MVQNPHTGRWFPATFGILVSSCQGLDSQPKICQSFCLYLEVFETHWALLYHPVTEYVTFHIYTSIWNNML